MFRVRVNGLDVRLEEAVTESAALLSRATMPLIAGLGGDLAALRAAIRLAERIGGVIDHCNSNITLRDLNVMQHSGWMTISPSEVARSCDLLLKVGIQRDEIRLRPSAQILEIAPEDLSILRALLRGHSPVQLNVPDTRLGSVAQALTSAKFGVVTWSAAQLNEPQIEMMMGLVRDLNEKTRFSGLPASVGDNAAGANLVSGWMTGFPVRTSFARGYPVYDPWAFDAQRLVERGETDVVLWLSAYRPSAPAWKAINPTIAIVAPGTKFRKPPRVLFEVGQPGKDHDAIEYRSELGALATVRAPAKSAAPRAAAILELIAGALP